MRARMQESLRQHIIWKSWPQRLKRWLLRIGVLETVVHRHSPFEPCTKDCHPKRES